MRYNVAVIGCGQLGRRHIQGLGLSKSKINVHIYDVDKASISECETFLGNISQTLNNLDYYFYDSIHALGKAVSFYDFVIIATTATNRPDQINNFFSLVNSQAWLLEKPICQSPHELIQMIKLTKDKKIWINHIRRILPWYRKIKTKYFNGQKISIVFSSKSIGIGCNISHLIDLVNFLTDEIPISTNTSGLLNEWHDSKRRGFKEIEGILTCNFSGGSKMKVISDQNLSKFMISGQFIDTGKNFIIDEHECTFTIQNKIEKLGKMPFQSQLTGQVFDQIQQKGISDLTPFPIAANCYQSIIEALLKHWQSSSGNQKDITIPIT